MPLKAASVSNQVVRKRKRKAQDEEAEHRQHAAEAQTPVPGDIGTDDLNTTADEVTTTRTVPTKIHDGGKKPRRTTKAKKPTLVRHNSSTVIESSIPWPEHFTRLQQVDRKSVV